MARSVPKAPFRRRNDAAPLRSRAARLSADVFSREPSPWERQRVIRVAPATIRPFSSSFEAVAHPFTRRSVRPSPRRGLNGPIEAFRRPFRDVTCERENRLVRPERLITEWFLSSAICTSVPRGNARQTLRPSPVALHRVSQPKPSNGCGVPSRCGASLASKVSSTCFWFELRP